MSVDVQDRAVIAELNARFAWALDLHDWDQLRHVLTEDVHYVSPGRDLRGADAVVASFRARPGGRTTRHGLGNLLLTEGAGGAVLGRSSWHTFATNTDPPPGVPLYMVADFHDTYTRDGVGTWRIADRVIVPVFRDATLAPQERP